MGNQRIKWMKAYETGIPEIDIQHKAIIDYTVQFRDVLENGSGETSYEGFLEFLEAYAEVHFAYEENCMFVHMCPAAGKNKEEHGDFLKLIETAKNEFERAGYDEARVVALLDVADNWLITHIGQIDIKLADTIAENKKKDAAKN